MGVSLNDIGKFVSTVGFPVAVAGYLLVRLNGKFDRLAHAVEQNTEALHKFIRSHARLQKK